MDAKARLEGVKALLRVRDEFRGIVDLQVVAFPQDGIVREPGAAELMHQAMALGADAVGGIPWIELTNDDAGDPDLRTLEMMAVEAIKRGWQGRALAHHCRAMSLYPTPYVQRLARLLRAAGVAVVTDPHTGPLHARVKELRAEGVRLCLGQDDISDAYYAFGRNNMLEVAFLAAHLLWMMTRQDVAALYDMITVEPAKAINLDGFGLSVGAPANLVVLGRPDEVEALRYHGPPAHVISHGKRLDAAKMQAIVAAGAGAA